jgi:chloramphenicol 3-O phosphotransferase
MDAARRLEGIPVIFVGVRCDVETIMQRRRASAGDAYVTTPAGDPVPEPVLRWQHEVHAHWAYDLDVDTSTNTPAQCAAAIQRRLDERPAPAALASVAG